MENPSPINENKQKIVKKVFSDFLAANGHKRTSERMVILEEIYNLDNHFDVVELHHHLSLNNYKVSMATIYNNLSLYVEAGLITKHNFGGSMTQYERCYSRGDHDHIIITDTREVREFQDPRIEIIKKEIEDTYHIKVERHCLYLYGTSKPAFSESKIPQD